MSSLNERINLARKQARLTQKELADRIHVSQTAIHKLECGRSKSSRRTVAIALTCGVDPIWLDTGRGEMSLHGASAGLSTADPNKMVEGGELYRYPLFARLPLIAWENVGGSCNQSIESFHAKAEAWLPIAPRSSDKSFALRVPDDSMAPEFQEGEVIIVDPTLPGKHNQFVIAQLEDESVATFKQLTIIGSQVFLKPLNTRYPLLDVQEKIKICGVIVSKYKEY
ncbi:MAG: LexA family transcriptional regulator [Magnetococcales bacterium]|nr:LexA family transcriptional regulator [Magnetococcales bacterium]